MGHGAAVTAILKEQPAAMLAAREEVMKTAIHRHYDKTVALQQRVAAQAEQQRFNNMFGPGSDPGADEGDLRAACATFSDLTRYPGIDAIQNSLAALGEERATAVYDASSKRLLQYHPWKGVAAPDAQVGWLRQQRQSREDIFKLQLALLPAYPAVKVRSDIAATGMVICSGEFLALFADAALSSSLRSAGGAFESVAGDMKDPHLIKDATACITALLALDKECTTNAPPRAKVCVDFLPARSFFRRVRTFDQYLDITRSVLGHWCSPLTPDAGFARRHWTSLTSPEPTVFIDATAAVGSRCAIHRCSSVAPRASVGDRCVVAQCVIGAGSTVGAGTSLHGTVVWRGVTIGKGCNIDGAVLCDGVVVGDFCTIEPGCILSFGVKLAANTSLTRETRVTCLVATRGAPTPASGITRGPSMHAPPPRPDGPLRSLGGIAAGLRAAPRPQQPEPSAAAPELESDADAVGENGVGRVFEFPTLGMALGFHCLSLPQDDDACSSVSLLDDSDDDTDSGDADGSRLDKEFDNEVLEILRATAADATIDPFVRLDVAVLGINTSKFAYDADVVDCGKAFLLAMLAMAEAEDDPQLAFLKLVREWGKVFLLLRRTDLETEQQEAEGDSSNHDLMEREVLITLVEYSALHQHVALHFGTYIHGLYDTDVLSAAVILSWEDEKVREAQQGRLTVLDEGLLRTCARLIEMLRESSSDEESD
eukprot:TRINITY_DN12927_c0_g1_i1.p1 TRINITY_DN12927_c0_g1~~TRINITY_DN12927_c0_g1_i1.p1  ORF type:complete len:760 (+),score=267.24 TRINITY_DN12927_c0_g1_i1:153-2282(+)